MDACTNSGRSKLRSNDGNTNDSIISLMMSGTFTIEAVLTMEAYRKRFATVNLFNEIVLFKKRQRQD